MPRFCSCKRSGGELTDIISQTAGIIRDKIQVQEEIHTMTAARVFEQKIMNGIPFGIILYIDLYISGLFPDHVSYMAWPDLYDGLPGGCMWVLCILQKILIFPYRKILKVYKMGQRENVEKDKSLEKTAALCWHRHVSWCCCLDPSGKGIL